MTNALKRFVLRAAEFSGWLLDADERVVSRALFALRNARRYRLVFQHRVPRQSSVPMTQPSAAAHKWRLQIAPVFYETLETLHSADYLMNLLPTIDGLLARIIDNPHPPEAEQMLIGNLRVHVIATQTIIVDEEQIPSLLIAYEVFPHLNIVRPIIVATSASAHAGPQVAEHLAEVLEYAARR
jgi:hypothetical protein